MTDADLVECRPAPPTPLRSLLFVPGHRDKWIDNARNSGADAIVFDLQDAVPTARIEDARTIVRTAIENFGTRGDRFLVRVSSIDTDSLEADLDAVVRPGLEGIMLPLVETPEQIRAVASRLDEIESDRGMPPGSTIVMPLVETAKAVRFSYELAISSDRIAFMGGATSANGDIARALGFRWSSSGIETLSLRSWVLMNVRAAGVPNPLSGVWTVVEDHEGLRGFAEQTRSLGYAGMMAIHPSHVQVINEVFSPTPSEIEHWVEILQTMRAAQSRGVGAVRLHGAMIDEADAKTAELMLDLAQRQGLMSN